MRRVATPQGTAGGGWRGALAALAALLCATWLAGCAATARTDTALHADAHAGARAVEIAPGVYMLQGAAGEVDPSNLGRIGNAGFIVGPNGVIAIDTGTSYRHGVALLAALRRVTDKPVVLAIVTHTRQEFLFGAAAYREQAIPLHMHRAAAGLMRSRCERCLKTLRQQLGDNEMRGTAMFTPDVEFDGAHTIERIGRRVQVIYAGPSSGPGDVAVFDPSTGVLFGGGLLDHQRIPDVQDSEPTAWKQALSALRGLPIRAVVPGHGPLASVAVIDDVERYLTRLEARVAQLLQAGTALSDVADAAAQPEVQAWDQYDTIHRRNASILFVRLERDQMFKRAAAEP